MLNLLKRLLVFGRNTADSLDWLAPLLMRIYFGYFWAETGWGKIHNLDAFTKRFIGWGIPYPHFNAVLSSYTEWVGGLLLMFGLLTPVASFALMFDMFIAIIRVKIREVTGIDDFAEMDEALYIFILFWLMMAGPGRISIDHMISHALGLVGPRASRQDRIGATNEPSSDAQRSPRQAGIPGEH